MFDVYDGNYKITIQPVSYNFLQTILATAKVPWPKISTLPLGEHITVNEFKIVRII